MNIERAFSISGVGKFLPAKAKTSAMIEQELNLPKNWISKNIGVETRYVVGEETNTTMGVHALKDALKDAQLEISDLDGIIGASASFDYIIPNRSTLIKNAFAEADELDFPCFDINTVCASFMTAVDYASYLFSSGEYQHIAIVSSEISSKGIYKKRVETYSLFGDGAAAIILSKSDQDAGLIAYSLKTFASGAKATIIEGGGSLNHPSDTPYDPGLYSFKMEGKKLLRIAKNKLPDFFDRFFDKAQIPMTKVDWIIPHQASKLGLRMLTQLNGGRTSNIVDYLVRYGNCIAASVPLALVTAIEEGKIKEGDTCFFIGTAAGVSISGLLIKYSKSWS